jgi:CheY-like chemotaxis protein
MKKTAAPFLVVSALELAGIEARSCATGSEALRLNTSFRPEALVLDVMLPDLDGFEVLKRLRNAGSHVPVLFLSAVAKPTFGVRGLTSGADDYIVKPFALVSELIAHSEAAATSPFTVSTVAGSDHVRIVGLCTTAGWVVAGISTARIESATRQLTIAAGAALVGVLAVLALLMLWVSRLGLRPISELTAAAEEIAGGRLDRRVPPGDEKTVTWIGSSSASTASIRAVNAPEAAPGSAFRSCAQPFKLMAAR